MVMVAMLSMLSLLATNAKTKSRQSLANIANDQRLSTGDFFQFLEKRRIRHSRRIGPENRGRAFRAQRGHRECHRNSVIAERIQFSAMQMLAARNPHSIGPLFAFRAHFVEVRSTGISSINAAVSAPAITAPFHAAPRASIDPTSSP